MKKILVIGGATIDLFAVSEAPITMKDSNPGDVFESFGGVGRNIAENLGRLALTPTLITAIASQDEDTFKSHLSLAGVDVEIIASATTSRYIAVLEADYDMHVAISAMKAIEGVRFTDFSRYLTMITDADILVLDTNLPITVLEQLIPITKAKIYVDAISTAKLLRVRNLLANFDVLKLNEVEARAILAHKGRIEDVCNALKSLGPKEVYLTLGKRGAFRVTKDTVQYRPAFKVEQGYSTGAGDAFLAGVIYADYHGHDPLLYGTLNARYCLETFHAVNPTLSASKLESLKERNQ